MQDTPRVSDIYRFFSCGLGDIRKMKYKFMYSATEAFYCFQIFECG